MSTRQLSLGDFAAHCLEEIESIQSGETVLEIIGGGGKVIAVVNPAQQGPDAGSPADWPGAGDAAAQEFWQPLTATQQAARQKVPIVHQAEEFYGDGTAAEWEGFDEALEQWRSEKIPAGDLLHAD